MDETVRSSLTRERVSTICDECSRVGLEISTNSKRKAIKKLIEDIVSTYSNIRVICVEQLMEQT